MVELWTPLVHGQWFLPSDIGQSFALTKVASGPKTPHNTLTGDVYEGLVPFLHFDVAQVRSGHIPAWNPYNGNGQPFAANGQSAVFSPYTGLYYLLGMRLALLAAALAKLWLAGFFTYLFLRRHGLREVSALVGGALFAYGGYHLVWLDYQTIIGVSALLPVALWLVRRALDSAARSAARRLTLVALAAVVGAMALSGHPETFLFDGLCIAGYGIGATCSAIRPWRHAAGWLLRFAGVALLGAGIGAVQLAPLAQYQSQSYRALHARSSADNVVPGFPADTIPMAAFPDLFGGPQYDYYDRALYVTHELSNYAEVNGTAVGLGALVLMPLGVLMLRRRRGAPRVRLLGWFGLTCVVVDALLLYVRWVGTLWWHLPGVGTAVLNRSQDIALIGVATLAALGVQALLDAGRDGRWRDLGARLSVSVVTGGLLTLFALTLRHSLARAHLSSGRGGAAGHLVATHMLEALLLAVGLVGAVAFVGLAGSTKLRIAGSVVAAVCAFASNGLVMRSYNTSVPTSLAYPATDGVQRVQRVLGTKEALFVADSFPWPDMNLWYGLHDVGSFDPLDFAWQTDLYRRVFGTPNNTGPGRMPACLGGLQLFGIGEVIGGGGAFEDAASAPLRPGGSLTSGVAYYPVPNGTLASVVGQSRQVDGDATALATVTRCTFDPTTTVVLDRADYAPGSRSAVGPVQGEAVTGAAATSWTGNGGLEVIARSTGRAWLLVRQSWAPDWSATVDGKPAVIRRADVAFMAVRVPAGTSHVVLTYHSGSLELGETVSLVTVAVAIGLVLVPAGRQRRRRTSS